MTEWLTALAEQLAADRELIRQLFAGEAVDSPLAPCVAQQRDAFGVVGPAAARLPEHFRGDWETARVCFLGPYVPFVASEPAPTVAATLDDYLAYYRQRVEKRDPYGHYQAIMGETPWLAGELVHWPGDKGLALATLKQGGTPAAAVGLDLVWALLRASQVSVLVLTGNDALQWALPALGYHGPKLPGVTQIHGHNLGRFPLPGAAGRELAVIASFHWSPEMPLFVRKAPGMAGLSVREAIGRARRTVSEAVATALA